MDKVIKAICVLICRKICADLCVFPNSAWNCFSVEGDRRRILNDIVLTHDGVDIALPAFLLNARKMDLVADCLFENDEIRRRNGSHAVFDLSVLSKQKIISVVVENERIIDLAVSAAVSFLIPDRNESVVILYLDLPLARIDPRFPGTRQKLVEASV